MAGSTGTIIPGFQFLEPILQDNTLIREFNDSLYPKLLYRMDTMADRWPANLGETQVFTRASLLAPVTTPLVAGADPVPQDVEFEQWSVTAAQYSGTVDTHTPSSRTALANTVLRNTKTLGLQAGQSLNRIVRDRLFCAYTSGHTQATAAGTSVTALPVESINGFTDVLDGAGKLQNVSAANPLAITIGGTAASVVGAAPSDPDVPRGPGTLTLAAAATWVVDAAVLSSDRPTIVRAGNAATVDALTATSALSLAEIRSAVATLRRNNVMPHEDGYFHVHLDPIAESQIFGDNEFQRLNQSLPDGMRYMNFAVANLLGCIFISNSESPNVSTSGTLVASNRGSAQVSANIGATVRNRAGIGIVRTIITGGGSIYERYIDEMEYLTDAGVTGRIGAFSIVNNTLVVPTERIRYIIRAPLDRVQQVISQTWSFSGDWAVPTDSGSAGTAASRYKRAIVIESGSTD